MTLNAEICFDIFPTSTAPAPAPAGKPLSLSSLQVFLSSLQVFSCRNRHHAPLCKGLRG